MGKTWIEWVMNADGTPGESSNPIIGCSRKSPGCGGGLRGPNGEQGGCYAERLAGLRFQANPNLPMWHGLATKVMKNGHPEGRWTGEIRFVPDRLGELVGRRTPTRVFFCDMGDAFHENTERDWLDASFGTMALTPENTYLLLTKREKVMHRYITEGSVERAILAVGKLGPEAMGIAPKTWKTFYAGRENAPIWPLPNVALGVSVEDLAYGVPRIDVLRRTSARWKYLSVEPLLEDIADALDLTGLDGVIVGGEAGPRSRPFELGWARRIQAQCRRQKVAFFMKQAGDAPHENGVLVQLRKKGNALAELPVELQERTHFLPGGAA